MVTVTLAVPAAAMSTAVIAAVSWVALTKVVALAAPLNFTTEVGTKPVPLTVSVNAAPPAVTLVGETEANVGAGLLMVNVCALEIPPPGGGFETVTFAVPPLAISAAGMVATICVLVTDDGAIAGFDPKFTVAPLAKPEPVTVKVKAAPPADALLGESDVTSRLALLIVNGMLEEVPPPGAGFVTVTVAVPAVAISAAAIAAVSCVELMNVVVLATPLNFTTDVDMKPAPFTVKVKAAPPAVALGGAIEISVGAGSVTENT